MLDFPSLKHKFSFFLDRKQTKVTLDIAAHSIIHSKHFDMPGFNETSTIRSLALHFHDNIVTLYVDCVESSKMDIGISMSKLYVQMDEPVMKLFRERKYPLHFDTTIQGAFGRANCQRGMHKHGNKRYPRIKSTADKGMCSNQFLLQLCIEYNWPLATGRSHSAVAVRVASNTPYACGT